MIFGKIAVRLAPHPLTVVATYAGEGASLFEVVFGGKEICVEFYQEALLGKLVKGPADLIRMRAVYFDSDREWLATVNGFESCEHKPRIAG